MMAAGQDHTTLEKRAVVSSFIFGYPNEPCEEPVVALFKRSDRVSTYRHRIAPISGSISRKDKDPLAAAWREISEETTLTPSTVAFWRMGMPFTFADESVGREWTVHPFGFRLRSSALGGGGKSAIRIDWEHEGWQWYNPTAVVNDAGFDGVPHLRESLRRVWFEGEMPDRVGRSLAAGLERLKNDHESGAQELTAIAGAVFRDLVVQMETTPDSLVWWETVRMTAWHLVKNGRESMGAATLNLLLVVLQDLEECWKLDTTSAQRLDRMLSVIDFHLQSRTSRARQVKDTFASYLRSAFLSNEEEARDRLTILTLSASSTIRDSIVDAFASVDVPTLELRILESRPLFEGVSMASSVLSEFQARYSSDSGRKLAISLYTDASAAVAAQNVDMVLLGADRISLSKGVSNKTGSLPVVLSAKHINPNVPVVVLSDLEKVNGETGLIDDEKHEDNDPKEVISAWSSDEIKGVQTVEEAVVHQSQPGNSSVDVRNIYFEWVPFSFVDAFISGEGVLDDRQIREKARQQGELSSRYFDSLPIRY
ncbi:hypothetical protein P175DRAFT_0553875 [Aspergillus ochraceoroseus IBT 24754]|uniref:Nudix hydrolase domain-containing protein n=2 Tax=Aspergillus ochraceoroseus TaxID=138278 RepID=A0A2T5M7S5_9EURO|nr:uncharacterized protein P175DRAFT_0553875 [Aspergillus ochraceoroseus IBT 24754]KKK22333.1 hypothetical protein AOCH_002188 [Aspergillus ochraceoroseus]PTU24589.1 hypothetical protein P175DRAFT_0553875 [Aspergillus ochraceoroseus IBT 24754]